jgi:hypothetical protein
MQFNRAEWRQLQSTEALGPLASRYHQLRCVKPDDGARATAAEFIDAQLALLGDVPSDLPDDAEGLEAWMAENARGVHARYQDYLQGRKDGAPRTLFTNRAHALYLLRSVAPTKLVDGAWLYGLVGHAANPAFHELVRTYVEELGEGMRDKNHVVLYRELLAHHDLSALEGLDDELYRQGLIQLSLAWNAERFLPEIVGFNLSYEQLPLHLLVTAYELDELGIDPYYFTLHVTVDNGSIGHARRACDAVRDTMPRLGDGNPFWQRVRNGAKLACAGLGTMDVARGFDIRAEVVRILAAKAPAGEGAHSDYCRIGGRSINEWLAEPARIGGLLDEMVRTGWIAPGQPAQDSRFWKLLQGPHAQMFGVFSGYELQVIHDWIRGAASADGLGFGESAPADRPRRRMSHRAAMRLAEARGEGLPPATDVLDAELQSFRSQLNGLGPHERQALLTQAMAPGMHWTETGMEATRMFWAGHSAR